MVLLCESCKANIAATQKRIKCTNCLEVFHSECVNFSNESSSLRATWKCPPCLSTSKKGKKVASISTSQSPTNTDSNEVILSELRAFRTEVNDRLNEHSEALRMLQLSVTTMKTDLAELQNKVKELEDKTECLNSIETKLAQITERNEDLEFQISLRDQRDRLNNIEISGVPQCPKENVSNTVIELAKHLKINIEKSDIEYAYRTKLPNMGKSSISSPQEEVLTEGVSFASVATTQKGLKGTRIVVRLKSRELKNELLRAAKSWQNDITGDFGLTTSDAGFSGDRRRIFFNDHLTPMNKLILRMARERAREKKYAFIWVKDCKVFVRKTEKSRVFVINKMSSIDKIIV